MLAYRHIILYADDTSMFVCSSSCSISCQFSTVIGTFKAWSCLENTGKQNSLIEYKYSKKFGFEYQIECRILAPIIYFSKCAMLFTSIDIFGPEQTQIFFRTCFCAPMRTMCDTAMTYSQRLSFEPLGWAVVAPQNV